MKREQTTPKSRTSSKRRRRTSTQCITKLSFTKMLKERSSLFDLFRLTVSLFIWKIYKFYLFSGLHVLFFTCLHNSIDSPCNFSLFIDFIVCPFQPADFIPAGFFAFLLLFSFESISFLIIPLSSIVYIIRYSPWTISICIDFIFSRVIVI